MKFLFVSDFEYNPNSGAAGSLIVIGEHLVQLGHSVDYIWRKEERYIKKNNYYRFLELPVVQYKQIEKAMYCNNYDVVMVSQPHAWLAFKKLKRKFPKVLFVNRTHGWEKRIEFDTRIQPPTSSLLSWISRKLTYRLISHCSRLTVKYSDLVIAACSDDVNYIQNDYPDYCKKVTFVSYGLSSDYLGLPLEKNAYGKIRFLYTGQYLERKGIPDLKEVFDKLKDRASEFELHFVINESAAQQAYNDFGFLNDSLIIHSWMPRNQLITEYMNSDVFLMASYGEGFGKTSIEAMACGLCVIGYKEGALADIGKHNEDMLLSDAGDRNDLLKNIQYSLDHINNIRQLGLNAYNKIQQYTWARCAEKTVELIEKHQIGNE